VARKIMGDREGFLDRCLGAATMEKGSHRQFFTVAPAAVKRGLADTREARHRFHGDSAKAFRVDEVSRSHQHSFAGCCVARTASGAGRLGVDRFHIYVTVRYVIQ
jgi:hypothetical protein